MDMKQIEKLEELNKLKEKGILTEEEFIQQKQHILSGTSETQKTELSLGYYFTNCVTSKYASFTGRARRKEYFGFMLYQFLLNNLLSIILLSLAGMEIATIVSQLCFFILLLPQISVTVRRLHDVNMSGWWILTIFVPMVVVFFESDKKENKYGAIPEGISIETK